MLYTQKIVNLRLIFFRFEFEIEGRDFCLPIWSFKGNFSSLLQGTIPPIGWWTDDVTRPCFELRKSENPTSLDRLYSETI